MDFSLTIKCRIWYADRCRGGLNYSVIGFALYFGVETGQVSVKLCETLYFGVGKIGS